MAFMKRVRLDDELISQGICADRADALRTLMAGLVSSGGERLTSPGSLKLAIMNWLSRLLKQKLLKMAAM